MNRVAACKAALVNTLSCKVWISLVHEAYEQVLILEFLAFC